jgi:hypothetical protein
MAISFEELANRAQKRAEKGGAKKNPEFRMPVEGDSDIVIPKPDAIVSMQSEKAGNLWDQLQVLTGKEFSRIIELVRGKDIRVVQDLITEMWSQWDDDSHTVAGGKED